MKYEIESANDLLITDIFHLQVNNMLFRNNAFIKTDVWQIYPLLSRTFRVTTRAVETVMTSNMSQISNNSTYIL